MLWQRNSEQAVPGWYGGSILRDQTPSISVLCRLQYPALIMWPRMAAPTSSVTSAFHLVEWGKKRNRVHPSFSYIYELEICF